MLQCLGMCLYMLFQVYVSVRYVFGYVVTGLLQCLGMCLDMLLQVYVRVNRYVFGYVVTGLCYSV